jgi:hypothetical protein
MNRCLCGHLETTHYTLTGCTTHTCTCPTYEHDDGTDGPTDDRTILGVGIYRQTGILCAMDLEEDDL